MWLWLWLQGTATDGATSLGPCRMGRDGGTAERDRETGSKSLLVTNREYEAVELTLSVRCMSIVKVTVRRRLEKGHRQREIAESP